MRHLLLLALLIPSAALAEGTDCTTLTDEAKKKVCEIHAVFKADCAALEGAEKTGCETAKTTAAKTTDCATLTSETAKAACETAKTTAAKTTDCAKLTSATAKAACEAAKPAKPARPRLKRSNNNRLEAETSDE